MISERDVLENKTLNAAIVALERVEHRWDGFYQYPVPTAATDEVIYIVLALTVVRTDLHEKNIMLTLRELE
jgi:hypothetical protein